MLITYYIEVMVGIQLKEQKNNRENELRFD